MLGEMLGFILVIGIASIPTIVISIYQEYKYHKGLK